MEKKHHTNFLKKKMDGKAPGNLQDCAGAVAFLEQGHLGVGVRTWFVGPELPIS